MLSRNLVIDVGMHAGHDTDFYLRKGFDVVAVEANPALVRQAEERFASEISEGRLRIFCVAIAQQRGEVRLAVADNDGLSSIVPTEIRHAERSGTRFRYLPVTGVPFADILREVGTPYYLKVDIEGMDLACVKALHVLDEPPTYVSIESAIKSPAPTLGLDAMFEELAEFWTLGYRGFKYVNQARPQHLSGAALEGSHLVQPTDAMSSSGAFGEEAPGRWLPVEQALLRAWALRIQHQLAGRGGRWADLPPGILYRATRSRAFKRPIGFFDLHAKWGSHPNPH